MIEDPDGPGQDPKEEATDEVDAVTPKMIEDPPGHGQDPKDEAEDAADAVKPKMIEDPDGHGQDPKDEADPDDENDTDAVKPGHVNEAVAVKPGDLDDDEADGVKPTAYKMMHAERQSYPWARMTTFWCTPENLEHIQHGRVLPDEAHPAAGTMSDNIQHGRELPDEEQKIIDHGGTAINFELGEELAAEESKHNALTSGGKVRRLLGG
jgi:hypothetical protein